MKNKKYYIILFFLLALFIQKNVNAQKTDTIFHINGNILTGELKKIEYGVVVFKMDGMGTINIEEVKVNSILSRKSFEIKLKNGVIYLASFDTTGFDRKVYLVFDTGRKSVNVEDIVEVYPIKRNFWMRSSGDFSLGVNYSKGSDVATLAFSGNLDYRKQKTYFNFFWDENTTFQADSISARKADITFVYQRLLKNRYSFEASIGASQNREMGTKLRLAVNGLALRDLMYSSWSRFYVGAGLTVTSETPYDDSGIQEDLAGLFSVVWKVFKYTHPKMWVDANISFIPYFTDSGRYRSVFNLNPKINLFSDNFKVGFKFYYSLDSKPPSDAASTSDYGINLQITYSFH